MNESIKIAIVDDHKLFVEGFTLLLSDIEEYEVVIAATSGDELIQKLNNSIDLLITDISMPEMDGIMISKWVRKRFPKIKIIALSMYENTEYIIKLMNVGVMGYLLKDSDIEEIQKAIKKVVVDDQHYFNEVVSKALLKRSKINLVNLPLGYQPIFTEKELNLMQCLCNGLTASECADKLNISPSTVNGHKERIMNKIGVNNTVLIVAYAIRNGLVLD